MSNGLVMRGSPARPDGGLSVIAKVPNPCHTALVDLDKDGTADLVVANLGSVTPGDHTRGSVVWLRGKKDGTFETTTLASGLPRVADVEAAKALLNKLFKALGPPKAASLGGLPERPDFLRERATQLAGVIDPTEKDVQVPKPPMGADAVQQMLKQLEEQGVVTPPAAPAAPASE